MQRTMKTLLAIGLLLPLSYSMKLYGASNDSSDGDAPHSPHVSLSVHASVTVVHYNAKQIADMKTVVERSESVHDTAMDAISKTLTLPKALLSLQHSSFANTSQLKEVTTLTNLVTGSGSGNLRAQKLAGLGGLEGARVMLNEMILEAMKKYDNEIAKCTDYYAKQCALMETARGQISASNFVAATARALILDAQANINKCQVDIPKVKQELKDQQAKCKNELKKLNTNLKAVLDDIAIMTMILEMSDCESNKKAFIQSSPFKLLHCQDCKTGKKYVSFNHSALDAKVQQLQSPGAQKLMASSFGDIFDEESALLQEEQKPTPAPPGTPTKAPPVKTAFNNPPMPVTVVPGNPCTDPNMGAPASGKRNSACTLGKNPQCYKLQQRFLQIQAGIQDERDALMDRIAKTDQDCKDTEATLLTTIENDESLLSATQTKLAAAMEKESTAGEQGRQVSKENDEYNADLVKQMKQCNTNYASFEEEMCALRKIRGEVFKKMQKGHTGFFQDCEVDKWVPEACTKKCAGGEQKIGRSVTAHPGPKESPGCGCLPLSAQRGCNHQPCPINCKLSPWGGWSKCSSKCGGGLQTRVRDVKQAMKYGGNPCGETSDARQCNNAACEKDCELRPWTQWTSCSKDCDGGSKKRERSIKAPAEGDGKCADKWDPTRHQYKNCNENRCKVPNPAEVLKCNRTLDIVLLLDGTPKGGKEAFAAEVKAANLFVDAFGTAGKGNFAVVHYTGPRTWSGVSKCTEKSSKPVDPEKDCHVKIASHFSTDTAAVKGVISGLKYQAGSKLLSLALMTVQSELALGRAGARTIVVVFIDGEPLSYRKTMLTARTIRKKSRLVFVAVNKLSPLASLKKWASRRWEENLVIVDEAKDLALPETGTHLVANICPDEFPKVVPQVPKKQQDNAPPSKKSTPQVNAPPAKKR